MVNLYDYVANNDLIKKFAVDDFLFVEYKCLFPEDKVGYYTSSNYFIYVLGGRKKWITGTSEYDVHGGDGIFIKRGAYVAQKYQDEDFCALVIFIPDNFIETVVKKYASQYPGRKHTPDNSDSIIGLHLDETFSAYFHSVLSYFPKNVSPPKELLLLKFEELILNILASPQNRELCTHFHAIRDQGKVSVRDMMEKNFMYNMSMEEYARLCARSLSSFKTEFCDVYNTSPGKWLITKRLEYAKFLLETTSDSVGDVSFKSGFKNTSHFVRIFKEQYGKPPLQYRQVQMTH